MWKWPLVVVLGTLTSVLHVSAQPRHDYWYLGESRDETQVEFIDAASIAQSKGAAKRAWVFTYHSLKSKILTGLHSADLEEYDCRTRQLRFLDVSLNDATGAPVSSAPGPETWDYAVPGTLGEQELNFVCGRSLSERRKQFAELYPQEIGEMERSAKRIFDGEFDKPPTPASSQNPFAKFDRSPEQILNRYEPDWRQLAATKAFKDWLATAPRWDQDAAQREGTQIVDAAEVEAVLQDFKRSRQYPATGASGVGAH
jgi:hypothetical protein